MRREPCPSLIPLIINCFLYETIYLDSVWLAVFAERCASTRENFSFLGKAGGLFGESDGQDI